jgi:hypothetical protein
MLETSNFGPQLLSNSCDEKPIGKKTAIGIRYFFLPDSLLALSIEEC